MSEETVFISTQNDFATTEEIYARKIDVPTKEAFEELNNSVGKMLKDYQQKDEAETFLRMSGEKPWDFEVFKDEEGHYVPYITFAALSKPYHDKEGNRTPFKMFKLTKDKLTELEALFWEIPQVAGLKTYPSYSNDRLVVVRGPLPDMRLSGHKLFKVHSEEGVIEKIPCFVGRASNVTANYVGYNDDVVFYNNIVCCNDPYFATEFKKFIKKYEKRMKRKDLVPYYSPVIGTGEWFDKKIRIPDDSNVMRKEKEVLEVRRPELIELEASA